MAAAHPPAGLSVAFSRQHSGHAHGPSPLRQSSRADDGPPSADPSEGSSGAPGSLPGSNPESAIAANATPPIDAPGREMDEAPSTFMISGAMSPEDGEVRRAWTPDSAVSRSPAEGDTSATSHPIPFSRFAKGRLASLKQSPPSTPTMQNSWEEVPTGSFDISAFENFDALDAQLEIDLKEQMGWRIERMAEDGNCFFRALSDQLHTTQDNHLALREKVVAHMDQYRDRYAPFVLDSEPFDHYLARKRRPFTFANDLEIGAAASALRRKIELYRYSPIPFLTYQPEPPLEPGEDHEPLRISYQRSNHYNSIRTDDAAAPSAAVPPLPAQAAPMQAARVNSDIFDMEVDRTVEIELGDGRMEVDGAGMVP
ncbi:hypothetical protein DFJ74DRAFT_737174 [Hyaloraphidium curvatum]|nr:hypothetical protein DFJ74DRAFT_737174 [Hyaloraphidium curvatum]